MNQENNDENVGYCNPPKDTRWKPGQSGNPKGRPKNTVYISEMLRDQLDQVPETINGKPNTMTWRDLICESILRAAVRGNQPAITKELLDRIEGKVTDKYDVTSREDSALIRLLEEIREAK
ncbi:DUF5681 domain-containing protein [Chloroflexota bacterium]